MASGGIMTTTISANSNNDIYIGANGSLSLSTGVNAVMQACQQAAQTQLGEMIYAIDEGIPNFETIWDGARNVPQFEAFLRQTILAVENVTGIESLEITIGANTLNYKAVIQTTFGTGVLNG